MAQQLLQQWCCFCQENSYTCSPDDLLTSCVHNGCNVQVHFKCARHVTSIRNITHGPNEPVYCAAHWVAVIAWNTKTTIEQDHLARSRLKYYVDNIKHKKSAPAVVDYPMTLMGFVFKMPLPQVNVWTTARDGHVQRHVHSASVHSCVETSIQKHGYDDTSGVNISVVEIPRSPAEVAQLQAGDHLPAEYCYPESLRELRAKDNTQTPWMIDASDPRFQMDLRRFVLIDGNSRVMALVKLTSEHNGTDMVFPHQLTCRLVDVEIDYPLAAQFASMKCNASHTWG